MQDKHEKNIAYGKSYRLKKKQQERMLAETKPGRFLRNNPDYMRIKAAIAAEKGG